MLHTFAVCVEDVPGALNRVASLFRRRGFNISSLAVGPAEAPGVSRMTISVDTTEGGARRIEANLMKLVDVLRVDNVTEVPCVIRELAMIKVAADTAARADVMRLVDVFRARVVDIGPESLMIETTGTEDKNDKLIEVLRPYGILELVRTGRVAMARGNARHSASDALQAEDDEEVHAADDVGLLDVSV